MSGRIDDPKQPRKPRPVTSRRGDLAELRSRAEQRAQAEEPAKTDTLWPAEAREAFDELRVHQIELEMQNAELRATQEQLEGAKTRYFDLYDLAPVGYLTLSERGLILEANRTTAKGLGVERGSLPGQPLSGFIPSDDQDVYYRHIRSLFESGQPQNCELRFKKKDNAPFWVRLESTVAAGEDGARVWRLIVSDITERKRAEDDLHKALLQLELITENMESGVARCSRDLRYLWVSRSYATWLRRERDQIVGRSILDVLGPKGFETKRPHFERVLSGEKEEYETYLTVPGVGSRLIHAVYVPTRDHDHQVDGWVGVVEDVTSERLAQEEAFARQKLETVGTLAGGIAHDFNNLLGGVLAQAELGLAQVDASTSPEEELKTIREVAVRGAEIVRQLMIYSGKETEVPGAVDLSRVVEEMLGLLRVSVSKHATLETDLGHDLPAVRGSAAQLRQIVMNLAINASEAIGHQDGVIRVAARGVTVDQDLGRKKGLAEGDYLQMEVSDTGQGMSPETQAKLFDPFFTTKSAGRGLGLAVVEGIVRGLGGTVHAASEPGKGTTFEVFLPAAANTAVAPGAPMSASRGLAGPPRALTVLVVEDEHPLRQAVAKMLRRAGFEVLEAANGKAAIDLLRESGNRIDAMLLDMSLPGRSSHDVAEVAAEVQPSLKVVLTSAYGEEMVRATVRATQTCSFVRKPFQLGALMQTLQNVLHPSAGSAVAGQAGE
jgi:two-component system, cell cycle sensor histidine kinase and response regulator CckA